MTEFFKDSEKHQTFAVAFLRIAIGILFAIAAWGKITALSVEPSWSQRMVGFINFQQDTPSWWRSFLDMVVLPNAEFFGYATAFGETAIAVGLIFGLFTRPAIVFAILFSLSMMLTKGTAFWTPSSNDTLYVLALLALFFMKPGETLSLDSGLFKQRFTRSST